VTSVDTVRDFLRFLTGRQLWPFRPLMANVEQPGVNTISYPGAITKSRNGSRRVTFSQIAKF